MNTTVKATAQKGGVFYYFVEDLENEVEIRAIIKEYEATLRPCLHCGATDASIKYSFSPEQKQPHCFYVDCSGRGDWRVPGENITFGCGIRTISDTADDNEENFRFLLGTLVNTWNRRPGEWESASHSPTLAED